MYTEFHQLVKNDFLVGNIEGRFEVKEGDHTGGRKTGVEFSEAVVCAAARKETVQAVGEFILETIHETSTSTKDAFEDFTEAGGERDGPEFVGSWFRYRNDGAGGPGGGHVSPAEAEIVELQKWVARNSLKETEDLIGEAIIPRGSIL